MSASTRTIQRPMGQGSIFGAVAVVAAALLAVGAIAWGALNLTATPHATTPALLAPTTFDKGGRLDAPAAGSIFDKGSRAELAPLGATYVQGKPGNVTPRFDAVGQSGQIYLLPGNQVAVPGFLKAETGTAAHGYMGAAAAAAALNAGGTVAPQIIDRNQDGNVVVSHGRGSRAS
jgi:hypothetical protein